MKWAIIGASDVAATQVIPALRSCGETPVVVMSSGRDWAEEFAAEHAIPAATDSLAEALAAVDAAYISSTNEKHLSQTIHALLAGVHVLCEKPLALDVRSARTMVQVARDAGLVLATNHHLRNSPVLAAMRTLIADGEIGELLSVHVNHAVSLPARLRGWRLDSPGAGGGVILDITVHDIDTIRFVTGLEPTSITAVAVSQGLGSGVPDAAMTAGTLGASTLFSTHDAFTVAHNVTSFAANGTRGTLTGRHCMTPAPVGTLELLRDGMTVLLDTEPVESLYTPNISAFVAAVAGDGAPLATGDDGRRSLETALGAVRALETGLTVTLDLDADAIEEAE